MKLKQHHTWLFCFTDLAFLLLISLSLIPNSPQEPYIHFALMDVPGVPANPNLSTVQPSDELWELHVYGDITENHPKPFQLVGMVKDGQNTRTIYEKFIEKDELLEELQRLKGRHLRPVLIPSKDSLRHDFLFAAGAIARTWEHAQSKALVKSFTPDEDDAQ